MGEVSTEDWFLLENFKVKKRRGKTLFIRFNSKKNIIMCTEGDMSYSLIYNCNLSSQPTESFLVANQINPGVCISIHTICVILSSIFKTK